MTDVSAFRYDGKRVLVVGGATGMGAAAAQTVSSLGGEVVVLDRRWSSRSRRRSRSTCATVPRSTRRSTRSVVRSRCSRPPGSPTARLDREDQLIAHRHIIEKLLADGKLPRGSSACLISSVAGLGWKPDRPHRVPRDPRLRVRGRVGAGSRRNGQLRSASRR
jgi:hypothetical protein